MVNNNQELHSITNVWFYSLLTFLIVTLTEDEAVNKTVSDGVTLFVYLRSIIQLFSEMRTRRFFSFFIFNISFLCFWHWLFFIWNVWSWMQRKSKSILKKHWSTRPFTLRCFLSTASCLSMALVSLRGFPCAHVFWSSGMWEIFKGSMTIHHWTPLRTLPRKCKWFYTLHNAVLQCTNTR